MTFYSKVFKQYRLKHEDFEFDQNDDLLGRGGFGAVYKAIWKGGIGGGKEVAVKELILKGGKVKLSDFYDKELIMLHVMRSVHPNVVPVYGFVLPELSMDCEEGATFSKYWLIMELMDGDLESLGKFKPSMYDKFVLMRKMAAGVAFLHSRKWLHRNIKCANFLYKEEKELYDGVKLCDFGICRSPEDKIHCVIAGKDSSRLWYAPEILEHQADGKNGIPFSQKTDMWALGLSFWELLIGENPFCFRTGEMTYEEVSKLILGPGPDTSKIMTPFSQFIELCCKPKPEERIDAEKLLEMLWKYEKMAQSFKDVYTLEELAQKVKKMGEK